MLGHLLKLQYKVDNLIFIKILVFNYPPPSPPGEDPQRYKIELYFQNKIFFVTDIHPKVAQRGPKRQQNGLNLEHKYMAIL